MTREPFLVHGCGHVFQSRERLHDDAEYKGLQTGADGQPLYECWTCYECGSTFCLSLDAQG